MDSERYLRDRLRKLDDTWLRVWPKWTNRDYVAVSDLLQRLGQEPVAAYCTGFRQAASFSEDRSSTEMLARAREYVRQRQGVYDDPARWGERFDLSYSDVSAAIENLPSVAPGAVDREVVLGILRSALRDALR